MPRMKVDSSELLAIVLEARKQGIEPSPAYILGKLGYVNTPPNRKTVRLEIEKGPTSKLLRKNEVRYKSTGATGYHAQEHTRLIDVADRMNTSELAVAIESKFNISDGLMVAIYETAELKELAEQFRPICEAVFEARGLPKWLLPFGKEFLAKWKKWDIQCRAVATAAHFAWLKQGDTATMPEPVFINIKVRAFKQLRREVNSLAA